MNYLDEAGLALLWQKIVAKFNTISPLDEGDAGTYLLTNGNGGRTWANIPGFTNSEIAQVFRQYFQESEIIQSPDSSDLWVKIRARFNE